uniref:Uncharacterized protein n=1 Tax=Anisakis simplex TaxID=6269 RepID=A0A0M3JFM3_ANISI
LGTMRILTDELLVETSTISSNRHRLSDLHCSRWHATAAAAAATTLQTTSCTVLDPPSGIL